MDKKSINLNDFSSERYKENDQYLDGRANLSRIEIIVENVGGNRVVLDIGCYEGSIAEAISRNNNRVFGIDVSLVGLGAAFKKGIPCICGDLSRCFPYHDESFDTVVAGEIIEHLIDTDFFLKEITRILKPQGRLILTTPNVASLGRRIMLLLGINPHFEASLTYPGMPAGHVRYYTQGLLGDFLKYHDFQMEKFCSNIVNFTSSGSISSRLLAKLFPGMGASLIFVARKK